MSVPKIVINDITKSFKDFYHDSLKAGNAIANKTKLNDVVVISKKTSFDQIEAYIGAILYKRISAIIPHPSKKVFQNEFVEKMQKIDSACSPTLCIADDKHKDVYDLWDTITDFSDENQAPIPDAPKKDDVAIIQLSSGTTGLPKVIKITHGSLLEQCCEYANVIDLGPDDVVVSWLPLYHDMGLIACFWMPLLTGTSFVHIDPFSWLSRPTELFEMIEKHKGTHIWMPNFAFSYMAKRCKKSTNDLSSVKEWISCSEMTHENDMMSFYNTFKPLGVTEKSLSICYAMAENVFAVSHCNGLISKNDTLCCGKFIPSTSVIIMDGEKLITRPCRLGREDIKNIPDEDLIKDIGEVYIKSSYLAENLPVNKYGYYNTGDMGFMHKDGLYIVGRSDDMIISYGKNIFPYNIEQYISNMKGIIPGRVACFGVHNEGKGTQDIFVVAESSETDTKQLTNDIIKLVLKEFEILPICKVVDKNYIIKTSSGKINRNKTRTKTLNDKNG